MKLLDLFCGAGVGAEGYTKAGYHVTGIDIINRRSYPYEFICADAFDILSDKSFLNNFDVIHASPPCQFHTRAKHLAHARGREGRYGDLLSPTIEYLSKIDIPWIVENVPGAPGMENSILLCGSMFNLEIQRHRLFLSNSEIFPPTVCNHKSFPIDENTGKPRPWGIYSVPGDNIPSGGRVAKNTNHALSLMGVERSIPISWKNLKEGIPPSYTEYLGNLLLKKF